MASKKKYPEEIFVSRENEGTADEYFSVNENADDVAEVGLTKLVGRYILQGVVKIKTNVICQEGQ